MVMLFRRCKNDVDQRAAAARELQIGNSTMAEKKSNLVLIAAVAANSAIAISKFIVASMTGSSSMLSEAIHSVVDTGNGLLMIMGVHRSRRPPDRLHPFGYGREIYFWSLIVAISIFGIGGGMSVYEGIRHLMHPEEMKEPLWNYVVLGVAAAFEGTSWGIALKEFLAKKKPDEGIFEKIHRSKDPTVFIILFEDTAALVGIGIAFLAVFLGHRFGNPYFDGAGSILIGLVLAAVALLLAMESKGLLLGEAATLEQVEEIHRIIESDPDVRRSSDALTMHLGPDEVLLNVNIEFRDGMKFENLETAVDRIEASIRKDHPEVSRIFIEVETLGGKGKETASSPTRART